MISTEDKLLKERIQYLLINKKVTINQIADSDSERIKLGRQINKDDTLVSVDTMRKLLFIFPDISADWLIMGEGSMYKADHTAPRIYNKNEVHDSKAGGSIHVGSSTIPHHVQALLDEKDKRIKELESDKQLLKGLLASFSKTAK